MKKNTLIMFYVVLALVVVQSQASILVFTYEGRGSGSLDNIPFTESDFLITAYADTDNRGSFSNGWFIEHISASISIDSLGDYDFLIHTETYVNNKHQSVGFSFFESHDLYNGPTNLQFATWDMMTPLGPISGAGTLLEWNFKLDLTAYPVNTTGGVLVFEDGTCNTTFTATPEPDTFALFAFGGLALRKGKRNGTRYHFQ